MNLSTVVWQYFSKSSSLKPSLSPFSRFTLLKNWFAASWIDSFFMSSFVNKSEKSSSSYSCSYFEVIIFKKWSLKWSLAILLFISLLSFRPFVWFSRYRLLFYSLNYGDSFVTEDSFFVNSTFKASLITDEVRLFSKVGRSLLYPLFKKTLKSVYTTSTFSSESSV